MLETNGWMLTLAQAGGSEVLGAPSGGGGASAPGAAESAPGGAAPPGPGGGQAQPGGFTMLLPLLFGLMIFMVITSMMSGRKEKKKRAEMMSSLKRRDKVQTIGGVIGTIAEIKADEVVLKVDHGSNTRIRFARSAIQQVLSSAPGASGEPDDGEIDEVSLENPSLVDEPARV